jgi:hypothetical protein
MKTVRGGQPTSGTRRFLDALRDELDAEVARRYRKSLGKKFWIVSWAESGDGLWLARLSGPEYPDTVERTGRSRSEAIASAARALRAAIVFEM